MRSLFKNEESVSHVYSFIYQIVLKLKIPILGHTIEIDQIDILFFSSINTVC